MLVSPCLSPVIHAEEQLTGFELYCDLVYADWLMQSGTCDKMIFHGKKIAWFVSDVTKKDWDWSASRRLYLG